MKVIGLTEGKSAEEMRRMNPGAFNPLINGRMLREPIRTLYIHSVAKQDFTVRNEPLFKKLVLRGCTNGERYVTCSSHPDPLPQSCTDHERGGTRIDDNDTWLCLIDLLKPGNYTLDPYAGSENPDFYANRIGTNLICEGVFPSENAIPTEAELRKAENARDRRYRWMTQEAMKLAAVSTKQLNEFLEQCPAVHIAMDALGLTAPWHQSNEVRTVCPNCGDPVRQGIAFHQSSAGMLCVIDEERYMRMKRMSEPEKRGPGRPPKTEEV